jgi:hypothetical protein
VLVLVYGYDLIPWEISGSIFKWSRQSTKGERLVRHCVAWNFYVNCR